MENKNNKKWSVGSIIAFIGIFVCFFGFAFAGMTGNFILIPFFFVGFPICGVIFSLLSTKNAKSLHDRLTSGLTQANSSSQMSNGKIICEYCGSSYNVNYDKCPSCGATNDKK